MRWSSQLSVVHSCSKWRHVLQRLLCYAKHKDNKAGRTTKSAAGPQGARDPKLWSQGFLLPHRRWPGVLSCPNQSSLLQSAQTWGERGKEGEVNSSAQHSLYNPLKGAVTWAKEHPSVMKVLSVQCLYFSPPIHFYGRIYLPVRFQDSCILRQLLSYVLSKQQNPDPVLQSFTLPLTSWRFKQLKTTGVVGVRQWA